MQGLEELTEEANVEEQRRTPWGVPGEISFRNARCRVEHQDQMVPRIQILCGFGLMVIVRADDLVQQRVEQGV